MAKRLTEATVDYYEEALEEIREIAGYDSAQEVAQRFVEIVYERFCDSLVLLRLFTTVRYDQLSGEDRRFVDNRGQATNTSHLIHAATPIFTLLGTSGTKSEWNDRCASAHFRCIPLASTAFVASLSMLSRQLECVGFDLGLIDAWETKVASTGRADQYRGMLYIGDSAMERDLQGRMVVPKQEFVASSGVKTSLGFGSGYTGHPTLVTLFAFTGETVEKSVAEPIAALLEAYMEITKELIANEKVFPDGKN